MEEQQKNEIVEFNAPELSSIEPSKADKIKSTFQPMAAMLKEFETSYGEVITESEAEITKELTAKAKRLRLDIGKVRVQTEKLRKSEKEEYLRAGKAIDGVSNILKWAVTDKENRLKEIEDHFEIMEQKRLEVLQTERADALSQYVEDAHDRDLAGMEEDVWSAYLTTKKQEHEDRLEAERKAEEERIAREKAEAEERERIRKENERLKKEAEANEQARKQEAEEKAALEAELKRQEDERLRIEQEQKAKEKIEAKAKAEAEKAAKNKAHRAKVNRDAAAALSAETWMTEDQAKAVVRAVASGKIPNMVINY